MFARLLALLLLLACSVAQAQSVTMPQSVPVAKGRLASVTMTYDGEDFAYSVPPELDAFREYGTTPNEVRLRVIAYENGTFRIVAVTCKGGKLSPFQSCLVVVGTPGPPPPVIDPIKPPPVDPPPPGPKVPLVGMRVLIVEETVPPSLTDVASLTRWRLQQNAINSTAVRAYLDAKCIKGPDGKTPEWRKHDQHAPATNMPTAFRELLSRPRSSVPWVVIAGSSGVAFEGALPPNEDEFRTLLTRYGGP